MNERLKSKTGSALSFKMPDPFDSMIRDVDDRSGFLKRSAALGLILYTKITGRQIATLLNAGLVGVSDIIMLVKAGCLSIQLVEGFFTLQEELQGQPRKELHKALMSLKQEILASSKTVAMRKARQANNRRRSI